MAITAVLVFAGRNRLRYLVVATAGGGETVAINLATNLANSIAGALQNILNVFGFGYGKIPPATVLSQAQGRALLASDDAASVLGPGIPSAITRIQPFATVTSNFTVDQGTLGGTTITANGIGSCYVEFVVPGVIGA